jgi:hypothetical protein
MLEGGDTGGMGGPGEPGTGGVDREEEILRQAAALEEAAADAPEPEEGSAADSPLADEVEV